MLIQLKDVSYIYSQGTPFEVRALDNINLEIDEGEFVAIIGHTGSGKSTLIQHFNGLVEPTIGEVIIEGESLKDAKINKAKIRQKIGLVFQYPEHQLFEETIAKDVAFGPLNLGYSPEETEIMVKDAMDRVGLPYEEFKDISPMDLSGGEKRRAAIAGVLVMNPKVLVLDEPTAGLDPKGRDDILDEIKRIYEELGITVILVSHSMDDVARLVDRIVVMEGGKVFMDDSPINVFRHEEELVQIGLGVPQITSFMKALKSKGIDVNTDIINIEDAKIEIERVLRGKENA
ncbi:MAG: energy-coupling factor transporter ATPase [Tissierellia bacterium]|nr:energy-coupling factor transporter ATPase [Tissierellia bacterium]